MPAYSAQQPMSGYDQPSGSFATHNQPLTVAWRGNMFMTDNTMPSLSSQSVLLDDIDHENRDSRDHVGVVLEGDETTDVLTEDTILGQASCSTDDLPQPLVEALIPTHTQRPLFECQICHSRFTMNKSLLRHMRTVHGPKAFSCPTCGMHFMRKDTRDRHHLEKHSNDNGFVKCLSCGRYVRQRSLPEHQDSHICRTSRALSAEHRPEEISLMAYDADSDPLLATLQMVKCFQSRRDWPGDEAMLYLRLKLRLRNPQAAIQASCLKSPALILLREGLSTPRTPSKALGLAALLMGYMVVATEDAWVDEAFMHFEGARQVFKAHHEAVCGCNNRLACPLWTPFDSRNPEVALLYRLLRELGIPHRLIDDSVWI